jgi:hypothetical protein
MPFTRLRQSLIKPNGSITGSLSGTSSYARRTLTASYALNSSGGGGGGGSVQTGSIANQTLWTNVTSGSTNTITGLNLSSNKWNVSVVEEWDAKAIPGDQYYNSCSLLMHFNGANGSTAFTDNSKNNLTVTSNNGAAISTAQSKFGGASVFFDGTDDYLSSVNNSAFNLSSGDFTVEFWFRTSTLSLPASHAVLVGQMSYTSAGWGIWQYSSTTVYVYIGTGFAIQTPSVFSSTSTWYHIALVKNGTGANSLKLYVDGVVQAQGNYTPTYASSYPLVIGGITTTTGWNNNFYSNGYIDELRITKGVARYTSNFTPPNSQFYNNQSTYQSLTKYIGTVGGLNDVNVDYGVQKLSDSSIKVVKMTIPGNPSSGSLSASIDRVYVNVLDYTKVSVTSSYARNALSASYLIPITTNTSKAIFGYGYNGSANVSTTNLVSNTGVVANDTTGVGTVRRELSAAGYGVDKAIFGYGITSVAVSMTNLVSNTGVVATDTTGVGTARTVSAAAGYGTDKAIFGYGYTSAVVSMTNLVSNTGVVATDTTGVGTARSNLAATGYGRDKAIFGYGYTTGNVSMTNLVSNTGVVATDTTGVGTARNNLAAAVYSSDKAIFGYGSTGTNVSITNLVSNTGVVSNDTTGVGSARIQLAAAVYGYDKAIFGYGYTSTEVSMVNLVSNTGVVANDTLGVGTSRRLLAAAGYSTT